MNEPTIDTRKLKGRRVLHVMSPVRWRGSRYEHEKCSNYKVMNKTINWLPQCHHYVLVPENNTIPTNRPNVTLIPFDYAGSVTFNRGHFNGREFVKLLNFRELDVDFIFNHQPELTYNVLNAIQVKRHGAHIKLFNFFHWVDTPNTKPSGEFPDGWIRQVESIHLGDATFFHCGESLKYMKTNFKNDNVFSGLNDEIVKQKIRYMPLGIDPLPEPLPCPLPRDKKIIVFNHRWNRTTGTEKLIKFTEGLSDEYLVWVTDDQAKKPKSGEPAPKRFHVQSLPFRNYLYLLQEAYTSVTFVDNYMTWNLSVQDSLTINRPSLVYKHPTHEYILGENYPLYFTDKESFQSSLNNIPNPFNWELPPHNDIFRDNLHKTMLEKIDEIKIPDSKYNIEWLYHVLNGNEYKRNILFNTHAKIFSSNVIPGLRLYCMEQGIEDDPTSQYTRLFIPNETIRDKIIKELDGKTFGDIKFDPDFLINSRNKFFDL